MNQASQSLRARRLELVQRVSGQRQDLRDQVRGIQDTLGNLAGGLSPARWLRASPLLVVAGMVLTLVVGRGRMLRTLGAGMAMVGLLKRYRNAFKVVAQLVSPSPDNQSVSRSR